MFEPSGEIRFNQKLLDSLQRQLSRVIERSYVLDCAVVVSG